MKGLAQVPWLEETGRAQAIWVGTEAKCTLPALPQSLFHAAICGISWDPVRCTAHCSMEGRGDEGREKGVEEHAWLRTRTLEGIHLGWEFRMIP